MEKSNKVERSEVWNNIYEVLARLDLKESKCDCLDRPSAATEIEQSVKKLLPIHNVSVSLPLDELGEFVDWITEIRFKKYKDGWCQAGGSNGWHCSTDELLQMFKDRGNDR